MSEETPDYVPLEPAAPSLSPDQQRALRVLAGLMIPASTPYGVPGADDPAIFADILASLGRDTEAVAVALASLDVLAGAVFADRPPARRHELAEAFRAAEPQYVPVLERVVAQCYYRDDRVMRSLDMEPRPPFPKGFEVEQGDWSLLDPVRARAPIYRQAP